MNKVGEGRASWKHSRDVYRLPALHVRPRAVYIHVPFCRHRCGYCDFTLVAGRDDLVRQYMKALSNEIAQLGEVCVVDSIFVGGGTPTHLLPKQLEQLLERIASGFRLASNGEYSFECNPDGLTDDKLSVLRNGGVNRISLGVQSFDADVLRTLERTHTPQVAQQVVTRVHHQIPNLSVDLMFGVPGQDLESWRKTLVTAVSLPVQHVSAYGLTFEKGTAFYRRRLRNLFPPVSSETERQQFATAMSVLSEAGLEQYEISNYARPQARCRHNGVYWSASEYFAFGPGAARYVDGIRSTNSRNVTRWIESWLQHLPLIQDCEQLSATERAREAVMLGLRRNCGIALDTFRERFGCTVSSLAPESLACHLQNGLLELTCSVAGTAESESWLRLTDEGRFLADSVVIDFL